MASTPSIDHRRREREQKKADKRRAREEAKAEKLAAEKAAAELAAEEAAKQAAAEQDYAAFAGLERSEREMAAFPPFGRLIALRWHGRAEERVEEAALACAERLRADGGDLLGPAPAPLAKHKGFYRRQALLRGTSIQRLQAIVARSLEPKATISQVADVALTVNVDPLTLM